MSELRVQPGKDGYVNITPKSAGRGYVGFVVGTMAAGETIKDNTGDRER